MKCEASLQSPLLQTSFWQKWYWTSQKASVQMFCGKENIRPASGVFISYRYLQRKSLKARKDFNQSWIHWREFPSLTCKKLNVTFHFSHFKSKFFYLLSTIGVWVALLRLPTTAWGENDSVSVLSLSAPVLTLGTAPRTRLQNQTSLVGLTWREWSTHSVHRVAKTARGNDLFFLHLTEQLTE